MLEIAAVRKAGSMVVTLSASPLYCTFGFFEIGFEGEVDYEFLTLASCGFIAGCAGREALVEKVANVAVHCVVVPGLDERDAEIDEFDWVELGSEGLPFGL